MSGHAGSVPEGGASLGARIPDRAWMLGMMRAYLAGRAAVEILLGTVSAGARGSEGSDLAEATRLACQLAGSTGLDHHPDGLVYRYEPGAPRRMDSLLAEPVFNGRVSALLQEAYAGALLLLQERQEKLIGLARALNEKGKLGAAEVIALSAPCDGAEEGLLTASTHAVSPGGRG